MLFQEFKQRYARPLFHFSPWKLIGTRCRDATNCVLNYCNRTIDICSLIFSCSCEELCPSSAAPKTVRLYFDTLKITPFLIMPFPSKITKLLDQCQYFSDCAPTPPLTKHIPLLFISWLLFGSGRGGCAVTQILTLIFINDRRGVRHMTENPTNAVPNYHLLYQIAFLRLPSVALQWGGAPYIRGPVFELGLLQWGKSLHILLIPPQIWVADTRSHP